MSVGGAPPAGAPRPGGPGGGPGLVSLVGAGPGDDGLLTLRGAECLAAADVVYFDALANSTLLTRHAPRAEHVLVGKTGAGGHLLPQAEISRRLVDDARAGRRVVRLKGGDPFLFGRGGEEAAALADAGIPFEVIPGVSSALAAPAWAGIPLTDRRLASSVAIVTGHEADADTSTVPWERLVVSAQTVVVLMGAARVERVVERLRRAGWPAEAPAACVSNGTLPGQRTVTSPLAGLAAAVRAGGLAAPAVIVVGEVVRLRERLAWAERRPLHGRTVLVTSPERADDPLEAALRALGADVRATPALVYAPPTSWRAADDALSALDGYDWVVFTSAPAARAFHARLADSGRDARAYGRARLAALGPATAAALGAAGLRPDLVADEARGEGLAAALRPHAAGGVRFLVPRAQEARAVLVDALRGAGASVDVAPVYRLEPCPRGLDAARDALSAGRVDAITFTSGGAVHRLVEHLGRPLAEALASVAVACIGPVTADALRRHGVEPAVVAPEASHAALAGALAAHLAPRASDAGGPAPGAEAVGTVPGTDAPGGAPPPAAPPAVA